MTSTVTLALSLLVARFSSEEMNGASEGRKEERKKLMNVERLNEEVNE